RSRRWRGDVPPARAPFLRRGGGRSPAAPDVPRGRPRRRGGAATHVPRPVLGRADHLQPAARPPEAADAPRAVRDRPGGARRLAQAHARRPRRPRPHRRAGRPALDLPRQRRPQPGGLPCIAGMTRHVDIPWWRDAVVYEIYVRSFADASGDGVGDLAGVRERLPYLRDLGVDAVWLTPFYPSPMADGGYDVADYR